MKDDWNRFIDGSTPSTVDIDPLFYEYVKNGSSVIDIGCGWGRQSFLLHEKGYKVTGIDYNQNEINYANELVNNNYNDIPSDITFEQADACSLPYEDSSFDSFIMQSLLTSIIERPQQKQAMHEANRILKKKGIGYIGVFCLTPNNPNYLKKYIMDFPVTRQWGTFIVRDKEGNGDKLFSAHHYSTQELSSLINEEFNVIAQKDTIFTSYHGNKANGRVIIVNKK